MRISRRLRISPARPAHRVPVPRPWVTALTAGWTVVALYVAQSFLPHNVISLPGQDGARSVATVVAPQGWAFFTKSATDPQYAPYRFLDGQWESASLTPHSRASNTFGFDRASRSQGIEIALLLHEEGIKWTRCDTSAPLGECLERAADQTIALTNSSPSPTLCGRAAVAEMHPVPWAWRHLSPDQHTPKRVAVWNVKCP